MKKFIILLIALSFISDAKFSLTGANVTDFPKVQFGFTATDLLGEPIEDIQESEFTIIENGIDVSESVEILCDATKELEEASILLVLDQSRSMRPSQDDPTNRWEWVVEASRRFIEAVQFEGRTQIGITKFGKKTNLLHPFSQDKNSLIEAVESTNPQGTSTFYNPAFLDPEVGAIKLLSEQPEDLKRVVVFLTDGLNTDTEQNKYQEIIDGLNANGISAYTVTLLMNMPNELVRIAEETGGSKFQVFDRERLSEIYELIAFDIQRIQTCTLQYLAPYGCDQDSRIRNISVQFDRDPDVTAKERQYYAPENSVAQFDISETLVNFGNPDPNTSSQSSTTISVLTAPLSIDNITIEPNTFFDLLNFEIDGVEAREGDVAQPGSDITLNLQFNQGDIKQFRQAKLQIDGEFCGPSVDLVGGFSKVFLINPKAEDFYSACETVTIKWAGVEPDTPVKLFYQAEGSNNWTPINNGLSVIGGEFIWTAPEKGRYKIRVLREEQQLYLWDFPITSEANAISTGIELSNDGAFIFNTGYFEDEINIKGETSVSTNPHDIYFSKFDRDGNLEFSKIFRGSGNDSTSGITRTPDGNIVICGTIENGITFDFLNPGITFDNKSYAFVAMFDENGTPLELRTFGARAGTANTEAWGRGVRYNEDNDRIEFVGNYSGPLDIRLQTSSKELPFGINDNTRPFIILLDDNLNTINAQSSGYPLEQFESYVKQDEIGNRYETAAFEGSNNQFGYESQGKFDSFISKFGKIEESVDENDDYFEIVKPEIVFNDNLADAGEVMLSESGIVTKVGVLKNPGELPVEIDNFNFDLEEPNEFELSSLLPEQILAGQSISIEFTFTPKELGERTGTFTIQGVCTEIVSIELTGIGTCRGEADESFDVGDAVTQLTKSTTAQDIFRNPTNQSIKIEPIIIDDPNNQFQVFVNDGGNRVASVNVPPFGSANIDIDFTPVSEGIQTAKIDYQVVEVCENVTTDLIGEGIESSIIATSEPITNRVFTVNQGTLTLENLAPLEVTVTDLELVDNNSNYFELSNLEDEYSIPGESSIEIKYTFNPQTEGEFSSGLRIVTSDGKVNESTIIEGIGLRPDLEIQFDCPESITEQGQTGLATLTITNTSQLETVRSINITSLSNVYEFINNTNVLNEFDLDPGEERNIDVNFNPITPNAIDPEFEISADAALGNNTDASYEDSKSFDISFEACPVEVSQTSDNVDFGNILICDKIGQESIIIENTTNSELIIAPEDFSLSRNDGIFILNLPNEPIVLSNNGDQVEIKIEFAPQEAINYNETLTISNNQGRLIQYNLLGRGVTWNLSASLENNFIKPNQSTEFDALTVSGSIVELAKGKAGWEVENLTIRLEYDVTVIQILDEVTDLSGLGINWNINFGNGYIELTADQPIPTAYNNDLFELTYTVFLSDKLESDIKYYVYYEDCKTPDFEPVTVNIGDFCAAKYRLIDPDVTPFNIEGPNPNPLNHNTEIVYSIPYDSFTTIEIFDMMGNSISTQFSGFTKEGEHKSVINIEQIPSGIYFLKVSTLLNSETKQIIISK